MTTLPVFSQSLFFKRRGVEIQRFQPDLSGQKSLEVLEAHNSQRERFQVIALIPLLEKIWGAQWHQYDEVVFICSDGYETGIDVPLLQTHKPYLAFAYTNQKEFTLINKLQANEKVRLGPFYLVWDNLHSKILLEMGAKLNPYQIVGLDLVFFRERYAKMFPGEGASALAKKGFKLFKSSCASCHTINHEGGKKAPELNVPVNITESLSEDKIEKWLDNPQSFRPGTRMPAYDIGDPDRKNSIKAIYHYLKEMKS